MIKELTTAGAAVTSVVARMIVVIIAIPITTVLVLDMFLPSQSALELRMRRKRNQKDFNTIWSPRFHP